MPAFYDTLPALPPEKALGGFAFHTPLPDNWSVAVIDIANSTAAIEDGRYKDVNMVAAAAIIAVLNALGRPSLPYVFGGDGATFLLPDSMLPKAAQALYGARQMSAAQFGLMLRAGFVKAADLAISGSPVRVAKLDAGGGIQQAVFSGSGVTLAEKLVKAPETCAKHDIETLFDAGFLAAEPADFSGLECRWKPLASRNGLDLSVIVQARGDESAAIGLYADVLGAIGRICGPREYWMPADEPNLAVTLTPAELATETKVRTHGCGAFARASYFFRLWGLSALGRICLRLGLRAGSFDGATYRRDTARNTDCIKFDNALRLVMDITPTQETEFAAYLDGLYREGRIFFGLFAAPSALMTCMVFDYISAHFHFVDGNNGGYAMAAKQLKAQIAQSVAAKRQKDG